MADPHSMKPNHARDRSPVLPPEGVIEMACAKFGDDPAQFHAYARFAGMVDGFLDEAGLDGWAALDMRAFIARASCTPSEGRTMCCMLATVLPWMVDAADMTRLDAMHQLSALLEICADDSQATSCVEQAMQRLDETDNSVCAELRH